MSECEFVHVHAVPLEARRGHHVSGVGTEHHDVGAGTELLSFTRALCVLFTAKPSPSLSYPFLKHSSRHREKVS